MMGKRIDRATSRTAAMTCVSRAASYLERDPYYHSNDHIAPKLLPRFMQGLVHVPWFRRSFVRYIAPHGIYEYVIARTKYIDAAFEEAVRDGFDHILLFGAGYDTRALRFPGEAERQPLIFELDEPHTQEAKIGQFTKRGIHVPPNLIFVSIDFDRESLSQKLDAAGFRKGDKTLFVLEGVIMYLEPASVDETFQVIENCAGAGSRVVFDSVRASVLRNERSLYGEKGIVRFVARSDEQWRFGLDPAEIALFAARHGFTVYDQKCAEELEETYFRDQDGRLAGRVNGTHCIVTLYR